MERDMSQRINGQKTVEEDDCEVGLFAFSTSSIFQRRVEQTKLENRITSDKGTTRHVREQTPLLYAALLVLLFKYLFFETVVNSLRKP